MPRRMQVEFSAIVQALADASETELTSEHLWDVFERTYLAPVQANPDFSYRTFLAPVLEQRRFIYRRHCLHPHPDGERIVLELADTEGHVRTVEGSGNGPIAATVAALGLALRIDSYEERSLGVGASAQALAIVEAALPTVPGSRFGVGRHENITTASIMAVLSAASRFAGEEQGKG